MGLARRQDEANGETCCIRPDVDLGREATSRAPKTLSTSAVVSIPFFAPAAQWCARTTVESTICMSNGAECHSAPFDTEGR